MRLLGVTANPFQRATQIGEALSRALKNRSEIERSIAGSVLGLNNDPNSSLTALTLNSHYIGFLNTLLKNLPNQFQQFLKSLRTIYSLGSEGFDK